MTTNWSLQKNAMTLHQNLNRNHYYKIRIPRCLSFKMYQPGKQYL